MYFMAIFYIIAGVLHFLIPEFYLSLMPWYLPYHLELVYLSGLCEILCGLLLVFKRTQILGAWLTIALLIGVCKFTSIFELICSFFIVPANIQMAQDYWSNNHPQKYLTLIRLPFQFVFIRWAYQYTKPIEYTKLN